MFRILKFCVNTNIFVAFAAFSLYRVTELLFSFQNLYLALFVFFSTLFAYNYMRIPSLLNANENYPQILWIKKNQTLMYCILLFSSFSVCFLTFLLGFKFFKLIVPALIIALLYPLSIKINQKEYGLRRIPFLKIFLISITWSYITLLVPLLYYDFEINYLLFDFLFQRILFIIAISIPFDIRDIDFDKIQTIPNVFGILQSKLFAWFCLFLIDVLLIIDLINDTITLPFFIALFISIEICSLIIYFTDHNKSYMFYGIFVEGLSIIMCLFVLIASFF